MPDRVFVTVISESGLVKERLRTVPRLPQTQVSTYQQMVDLSRLAVHFGLYDADDWIRNNFFRGTSHIPRRP